MGRDVVGGEEVEAEVAARDRPGARQDTRHQRLPDTKRILENFLRGVQTRCGGGAIIVNCPP